MFTIGDNMEILVTDLDKHNVTSASGVERHYGEFKIQVKIEDKWYDVVKSNGSHMFGESYAEELIKKYGDEDDELIYRFIHDPRLWEEDIGEFDGYYGDGLDHIDELYYMD